MPNNNIPTNTTRGHTVGLISFKNTDELNQRDVLNAIDSYRGISSSRAGFTNFRQFQHILPNISVRDEMTRNDYARFRPSEGLPEKTRDKIAMCMEAYSKVGIVRNVVDLMADFATQGIELVHPNPQIQKFYRGWFQKVRGKNRSERFLNIFYRAGNVVAKRATGKLDMRAETLIRSLGNETVILENDNANPDEVKTTRRVIPIRYDFLNPLVVEVAGGALAQFVGKQIYALKVPANVIRAVTAPQTPFEKELVNSVPDDLYRRIKNGEQLIPLPQEKLRVFHYRKDDWQDLAEPMIFCIMNDLVLLEKMQLADLAALDGAISQIRIWKLGNLEQGIFPTDAAIAKLAEILMSNPGGGAFDLIWGPDLTVEEYKTNIHQFLGSTKYEPVMTNIHAGLGVPPTLTGSANAAGFTNNFLSLKTLIQRLEYGREALKEFWDFEIELVRQAMGFRFGAEVRYDRMILSDEAAEKALLLQLADRFRVSDETLLERFGESADLETLRLRREQREREKGTRVQVGGQWSTPDKEFELTKLALQRLLMSPNEAGITIEEKFEKPPFLMQLDSAEKVKSMGGPAGSPPNTAPKGRSGQGRPKNSFDSKKRAIKTVKPRTSAEEMDVDDTAMFLTTMSWAKDIQSTIADIVVPGMLNYYEKKDLRSLTEDQYRELETMKFAILANLTPFEKVGVDTINDIVSGAKLSVPWEFKLLYDKFVEEFRKQKSKEPTIDDQRNIQAAVYALLTNTEDETPNE